MMVHLAFHLYKIHFTGIFWRFFLSSTGFFMRYMLFSLYKNAVSPLFYINLSKKYRLICRVNVI